MTDPEILTKAIEKAIRNGYVPIKLDHNEVFLGMKTDYGITFHKRKKYQRLTVEQSRHGVRRDMYRIIFSHEWAKAFWGEREWDYASNGEKAGFKKLGWQYHLPKMVLEENPLSYIARFLEKEDTAQ